MPADACCRFCNAPLEETFADLGMSPLCESFVAPEDRNRMEPFYPLHVWVCTQCYLVQLEEYVSPEAIFSEYAYFSSYSDSWLAHAERYVGVATERFGLNDTHHVVEIASNDGYLLQYFVERNIPVTGIEPAANVAAAARKKGVNTVVRFFGTETARDLAVEGKTADLIVGNNVLAHVPDINDFVAGIATLLKEEGVVTMEFPHLLQLVDNNQFDTIYHEHFSYLSLMVVARIFAAHGMRVFDVDEIPTHGGSLRIYACHEDASHGGQGSVLQLIEREEAAGYRALATYTAFGEKVSATKNKLLRFLIEAKEAGKVVAGYGAPGKGNTFLNYAGIKPDLLAYTVDRNPYKHGRFCPGSRIPIYPVEQIDQTKPDYLLILPWNLREEIMGQMVRIREWGGKFVVPIPEVQVHD
jgi:SAM-dependent methyltransferase